MERLLLRRELYGNTGETSVGSLYGSKKFVDDLDITNELYGHTGCVNALRFVITELYRLHVFSMHSKGIKLLEAVANIIRPLKLVRLW